MIDATRTTTALLEGLHDHRDARAWDEFDRRYRPIIIAFARKLGVNEADAADVAQETLTSFLSEYQQGKYDRSRGRLRSWLIGLAKYRIMALRRTANTRHEQPLGGELSPALLDDEQRLTRIWDEQERASMLATALEQLKSATRLKPQTLRVFELLVLRQMPASAVAGELEISEQEVYLAKSRVAQRLRGILSELQAAYEMGAGEQIDVVADAAHQGEAEKHGKG